MAKISLPSANLPLIDEQTGALCIEWLAAYTRMVNTANAVPSRGGVRKIQLPNPHLFPIAAGQTMNVEWYSMFNRMAQAASDIDDLESLVTGVTIIPAANEFAYHPEEVRTYNEWGGSYSENRHSLFGDSDLCVSIDQLKTAAPNCSTTSLFIAWFGSDLRCGNCSVKPKVDTVIKTTFPIEWGVSGLTRSTAEATSIEGFRPAYGGTPSDNTVIACIEYLKARDFEVLFTPFLLMDIPSDNMLPDPYTGDTGQPAYPWRGRITCDPAPGQAGSPDQTSAAAVQVSTFFGTAAPADFSIVDDAVIYSGPDEWTYRRFILHNAMLCKAAGGVSGFMIGSEMRGLTWVRDSASTYPFVSALIALAADVKSILPDADITYAADWTEYFGHQPADGSDDVYFHLDPLWADSNIAAIAIDNYWPLSDWRDGTAHLDWQNFSSDLNLDYLQGNIEGGEGYSWYYATMADRDSQTRTPITDSLGKPWVFRFKDIRSWWSNAHFNRPGGIEDGSPTAWVPKSKPIWFTELGCPAVNKGANQPNVFVDVKSSESAYPYYSNETRDDLIQRAYLRAFLQWYDPDDLNFDESRNPQSDVYVGRMVNENRIMLYTWDARSFPEFPLMTSIWVDGLNWPFGHWLTGRLAKLSMQYYADTYDRTWS